MKTIFLLLFSINCNAQNNIHGCPMNGDRNIGADTLKNRWAIPSKYNPVHLSYLLTLKNNSFKSTAPVEIEGYILEVKDGSLESCNCHSSTYKDTHIYVAVDMKQGKRDAMVVEVTPRLREKNPDWTTKKLKQLVGKQVIIDGYLFCDSEHKQNSKADGGAANVWRSTVYEIHPVTQITIL